MTNFTFNKPKKDRVNVSVSEEMLAELIRIAEKEQVNIPSVVYSFMEFGLNEYLNQESGV